MAPTLWRVFPWDPGAGQGEPFSPRYLPKQSGQGRFDLPLSTGASAWYFAESPEHALAEKLQDLRGRMLHDDFLFERGRRLALSSTQPNGVLRLVDLCDPVELARRGIAPDRLAFRDRSVTQAIARELHREPELAGFRWWSALFGEWHTVVLFSDRLPNDALPFSEPRTLRLDSATVALTAAALAIEIAGS
jgi:hypothetical protein